MSDRKHDVSRALTEVRTVLSRAETALDALARDRDRNGEILRRYVKGEWQEYAYKTDPEIVQMMLAMVAVVDRLECWRGTRKSRGQRHREWYAAWVEANASQN